MCRLYPTKVSIRNTGIPFSDGKFQSGFCRAGAGPGYWGHPERLMVGPSNWSVNTSDDGYTPHIPPKNWHNLLTSDILFWRINSKTWSPGVQSSRLDGRKIAFDVIDSFMEVSHPSLNFVFFCWMCLLKGADQKNDIRHATEWSGTSWNPHPYFIKQIRWATSPFIHTSIVPSFHYFSIMLAIQLIYRSCWPWPAHFSFNQLEWLEGSDQELGYDEIFSWWGAITWCRDHSHAATPFFNSSSSVVSSPPLHMPGCFNLRSCCSSSGGRLRCPQSYPVMCQNQDTKIWRDDSEQTRLHY